MWTYLAWFLALDLVKDAFLWATKSALAFESAFIGIRKTLDWTEADFKKIENWIRALSKEIPLTVEELSKIAEIWGQLWIATDDILIFTETVAMIWATTNLSAEEAATSFARLSNVLWEPISNIDQMASSVVWLGNNFATTESEILNFANQMVSASAVAWLTSADVFGISTAFTSVWINAEAWWSAVSKALLEINTATIQGWEQLNKFAQVTWMTAEEFKKSWKDDAWWTFAEFVEWLWDQWDNAVTILQELLWTDIRTTKAFLWLAEAWDLVTKAINTSNKEFEENNALQEEAEKRFESNESKLIIAKNKWTDFWATIWTVTNKWLIPFIGKMTDFFTRDLDFFLRIWMASLRDFFTIVIPTLLGNWLQAFKNMLFNVWVWVGNMKSHMRTFATDLKTVISVWVWTALDNAGIMFSNLWKNIWTSLWNIKVYAKKWLDWFLELIEETVNKAIDTVNLLPWIEIDPIKWLTIWDVGTEWALVDIMAWTKDIWWAITSALSKSKPAILGEYKSITAWFKDIKTELQSWITKTALDAYAKELEGWKDYWKERKKQIEGEIKDEQDKLKKMLGLFWDDWKWAWGWKGWGWSKWWAWLSDQAKKEAKEAEELVKKLAKETEKLKKESQKAYDSIWKDIDKTVDWFEKYINEIAKWEKAIEDFEEKTTKSLRSVKNEIDELNDSFNLKVSEEKGDTEQKLAERRIEALEKEEEIQKELNKLAKQWIDTNLAKSIWLSTLESMSWDSTIWGQKVDDLLKVVELQNELNDLAKERWFIEENTTKEVREDVERFSWLSESEQIKEKEATKIKELEAEKEKNLAILEEKQFILQSILEGEKINLEEIKNVKNLELAEELLAKQMTLGANLEASKMAYQEEINSLRGLMDEKKTAERDYTEFFDEEIENRLAINNKLQESLRKTISLQKEAWVRLAQAQWGTTSPITNNNTTLNNTNNITSDVDLESANRNLATKILS